MNNNCYIDSSQSYCLYQIRIYLYQVAKRKQNGTNIGHSKYSIVGLTDKGK